jgi:PAS domain S-box-containing protein
MCVPDPPINYKQILDSSRDGVAINTGMNIMYVNEPFAKMLGYSAEGLLDMNVLDITAPEYRESINERTSRRQNGETAVSQFVTELVRKDGTRLPVELSVSLIDFKGKRSSLTIIREISERMEAEEELRKSEERFRGLVQSALERIAIFDKGLHYVDVNKSWLRMAGLEREDIIGKHVLEVLPGLKEDGRYDAYLKVLETREPIELVGIESITRPGSMLDISVFTAGDVLGLISRDSTRRMTYQGRLEALHVYGSKLSKAESLEEVAQFTLDAVESIFGYQYTDFNLVIDDYLVPSLIKDEALRKNLELHIDGPGIIVRAYKTGESQLVHDTRLDEAYVYGRGEDTEWLSELAVPVKISDEVVAVINMEHPELGAFTESDRKLIETLAIHVSSALESLRARETHDNIYRQMTEQKLRAEQAQELEQIKTNFIMKATHELRTPLTIIKGYSELLLDEDMHRNPKTLVDFLSVILKNVKRSEILINDLLDESLLMSGNYVLNAQLNDVYNLVDDVKKDAEIFLVPKK